jgi:NAD(P)-dependent dehydrogenase (short-subunit alcohol dehydrogenase family)
MTGNDRRVAIITGGSQGIGASLVAGYVGHGWAVVANARTIGPSADPGVLTVEGDTPCSPGSTWAGSSG